MRKHSLEVTHGDYRRESFHCEHSLQSLLEIEGENGPAPPSPSSSSSPSPPMGGEIGGLKPARRVGRQESPLSRDTLLTGKEKDPQTKTSELSASQTESIAPKSESKTSAVDTSKALSAAKVSKSKVSPTEIMSRPALAPATAETKPSPEVKPSNASTPTSEPITKSKPSEKTSTPATSKGFQPQDSKQQGTQTDSGPAAKPQEKTEEKGKGPAGADKNIVQKAASTEQSKVCKGTGTGEGLVKGVTSVSDKATEVSKVKGPAPPIPKQVQAQTATVSAAVPLVTRAKVEKVSGPSSSYGGAKEERVRLEVLEENPMSPSSNAASPSTGKSRPMSPGDKASFVTQLTSVAKTVLGPMKGASQEGAKGKDTSKASEERRVKPEAASAGGRRGLQTASSGSTGTVQSDKGNTWSSKHH